MCPDSGKIKHMIMHFDKQDSGVERGRSGQENECMDQKERSITSRTKFCGGCYTEIWGEGGEQKIIGMESNT